MKQVLVDALARRRGGLPPDTDCFRWIDGELPDVTVDVFGDAGVLSYYRPAPPGEELRLAERCVEVAGLSSVYLKRRPPEARRAANEQPLEVAPPAPLVGAHRDALVARESGVRFEIRPANGLSVGLYLDARDARTWVRGHAAGRRVLNTFAYTCGFGLAASLGGAARAVNVDASRKVLDWGEANYALNGLSPARVNFVSGDAFDWLSRFAKKGEQFELVVLDPPGFATTKSRRFSAQRDYHALVAAAAAVLAPTGLLLAMCNVERLSERDFTGHVERGLAGRSAKLVARFGASPVDFAQPSALKCLAIEVGARPASAARRPSESAPR